jgi:hypothetical protein
LEEKVRKGKFVLWHKYERERMATRNSLSSQSIKFEIDRCHGNAGENSLEIDDNLVESFSQENEKCHIGGVNEHVSVIRAL